MPNRGYSSSSYRYGFNGQEKDNEIKGEGNCLDFGARMYDSRLGKTLSQDPHSAKYPNMSPYSMMANNPILYIDADGKDIGISTTFKEDGTKVISIVITGKLINNSSTAYTKEQMGAYADRIANEIIKDYTVNTPGVETIVSVYLTPIVSEVQLTESDHAFRIVDQGKIPTNNGGYVKALGRGLFGQNVVYLSQDILDNKEAETGKYAGTGKTQDGKGTLERTSAHEFGHSGTLEHVQPRTQDGNLMHQTGQPNAGKEVTKEQILELEKSYYDGELNKGQQSEPSEPKKK